MGKKKKIPTVEPSLEDKFHFSVEGWVEPVPNFDKIFHISRLEDYLDKMSFPLPVHRKVVYDMIFLTKGKSLRSKGLNQYQFQKNQVFFLPPYQITSHESMSEDVTGYFIHFSEELFKDKGKLLKPFEFLGFSSYPIVTIPIDKLEPIFYLFERMIKLYYGKNANLELLISYLLVLLAEINQYAESTNPLLKKVTMGTQLTERYKDALAQYIYQKQTVKEYAQLLFVTPNYLNRCVKGTTNKTAQKLLNEMLVLEAKSLLRYSGLSISEIAEKLFQRSPSNFARFFKHQTGVSPKGYIKMAK